MATAYVGMGANLGDRAKTLRCSAAALGQHPALRLIDGSDLYETDPVGYTDQPEFVNAVLKVGTALSARGLLDVLLGVERAYGRVRGEKWGPRTLDLDLLLYDRKIIDDEGLCVPHPYLHERAFVLIPLCDLDPDGVHPLLNQTFRGLAHCAGSGCHIRRVKGVSLLPGAR